MIERFAEPDTLNPPPVPVTVIVALLVRLAVFGTERESVTMPPQVAIPLFERVEVTRLGTPLTVNETVDEKPLTQATPTE